MVTCLGLQVCGSLLLPADVSQGDGGRQGVHGGDVAEEVTDVS